MNLNFQKATQKRQKHTVKILVYQSKFVTDLDIEDFPGGSDGKVPVYNAGDPGLIPGSGRSPGEGNGNPLQD